MQTRIRISNTQTQKRLEIESADNILKGLGITTLGGVIAIPFFGFSSPFAIIFYIMIAMSIPIFMILILPSSIKRLVSKGYEKGLLTFLLSILTLFGGSLLSFQFQSTKILDFSLVLSIFIFAMSILLGVFQIIKNSKEKYFLFSKQYSGENQDIIQSSNTLHHQSFINHKNIENRYYKSFVLDFLSKVYFAFLVIFGTLHFILVSGYLGALYSGINLKDILHIYLLGTGIIYIIGLIFSSIYFFMEKRVLRTFILKKSILLNLKANTYINIREGVIAFSKTEIEYPHINRK